MTPRIIAIGASVPKQEKKAATHAAKLGFDLKTLESKIGTDSLPVLEEGQDTSDMAVNAVRDVMTMGLKADCIDALILCTQNPDANGLPHTSAIVHGKLDLLTTCMCFDISLGCSGYVHGLAVARGLMESYGLRNVLLVTADPYSKIVDEDDAHTSLIFGDGACATWISTEQDERGLAIGAMKFFTNGKDGHNLMVMEDGLFHMNGREVFFFAAKVVPDQVQALLKDEALTTDDVSLFVFHQGSKYIVETISKRLGLSSEKVPSNINTYGNLVSSSIPMLLKDYLHNAAVETVVVSGFGVGLSAASMILSTKP